MKVAGTYQFDGPPDVVWATLMDPEVLASVLPGCEKLDLVGENEYEGALKIKVGPVQGTFMGKVRLDDLNPPDSYTMHVDGRGAPGFVKAQGALRLAAADAGTEVSYEGDARVGGKLASVGQRLVESSAKAIIKQSLDGLNASVRARVDVPQGSTAPPPAVEAPTQQEFARAVAREVARDLAPGWVRPGLLILALAVAAAAVWLIFW